MCVQEVVALWEDLRRHDISPEKRSKLITAVLAKVWGAMPPTLSPCADTRTRPLMPMPTNSSSLKPMTAVRRERLGSSCVWRRQLCGKRGVAASHHLALGFNRSTLPLAPSLLQVKGRVAELAASHTASRVIQACVKYGTPAGAIHKGQQLRQQEEEAQQHQQHQQALPSSKRRPSVHLTLLPPGTALSSSLALLPPQALPQLLQKGSGKRCDPLHLLPKR